MQSSLAPRQIVATVESAGTMHAFTAFSTAASFRPANPLLALAPVQAGLVLMRAPRIRGRRRA